MMIIAIELSCRSMMIYSSDFEWPNLIINKKISHAINLIAYSVQ